MFNNLTTCKVSSFKHVRGCSCRQAQSIIGGMHKTGTTVNSCNLMFGRQPEAGEGEIYMKMLEFHDIDFDCPLA